MKPASLPLPSHLGIGAVMTLVIFGTALLSPVKGETAMDLTCQSSGGSEVKCPAGKEACCFREYRKIEPRKGCWDPSQCGGTECVDNGNPNNPGIRCYCTKNNCNGQTDNPWGADTLYKQHHSGSGPGSSSTTRPNCNKSALVPGLLVVVAVAALSPLPPNRPHLTFT